MLNMSTMRNLAQTHNDDFVLCKLWINFEEAAHFRVLYAKKYASLEKKYATAGCDSCD